MRDEDEREKTIRDKKKNLDTTVGSPVTMGSRVRFRLSLTLFVLIFVNPTESTLKHNRTEYRCIKRDQIHLGEISVETLNMQQKQEPRTAIQCIHRPVIYYRTQYRL